MGRTISEISVPTDKREASNFILNWLVRNGFDILERKSAGNVIEKSIKGAKMSSIPMFYDTLKEYQSLNITSPEKMMMVILTELWMELEGNSIPSSGFRLRLSEIPPSSWHFTYELWTIDGS